LGLGDGDGSLLSRRLRLREHGRLPRGRGGRAVGALRGNRGPARPGPALAALGPRDAAVPALAGWHPVRGRLLGEALRLLGRRGRRPLLAPPPPPPALRRRG